MPTKYCDLTPEQKRRKNIQAIAARKKRYHSDPVFRAYVIQKSHETAMRRKYGLEPTDVKHMLKAQDGKCPICRISIQDDPHIDHAHKTNRVRGLLCGPCNRGIGLLHESIESLQNAIKYLGG